MENIILVDTMFRNVGYEIMKTCKVNVESRDFCVRYIFYRDGERLQRDESFENIVEHIQDQTKETDRFKKYR
jgi:hypothetical protein